MQSFHPQSTYNLIMYLSNLWRLQYIYCTWYRKLQSTHSYANHRMSTTNDPWTHGIDEHDAIFIFDISMPWKLSYCFLVIQCIAFISNILYKLVSEYASFWTSELLGFATFAVYNWKKPFQGVRELCGIRLGYLCSYV